MSWREEEGEEEEGEEEEWAGHEALKLEKNEQSFGEIGKRR